jgi:hypothetical protein
VDINKDLLRLGIFAAFIAGVLAISWLGGYLTGRAFDSYQGGQAREMGISQVLQELPLDQAISVRGSVSRVLSDYTSKEGYVYQQFYITDGAKELKVFCSKYRGSADVRKNDNVSVTGVFQKYGSDYELHMECSGVEVL